MSSFPVSDFNPAPAPPQKSKSLRWIVIIAGVGLVGMVLCCGGPLLLTYFGFNFAGKILASQVRTMIESNPDFASEIGTIESMEMNIMESARYKQEKGDEGLVFDVKGSRGSGQLFVVPEPGGKEFSMIVLRLPDGREIELLSAELDVSMPELN